MKARGSSKAANSADLLVCFPSRAHLTLMPKPICSPARHSESNKRSHHHHNHHQHLKRSTTKNGGQGNSPVLWAKSKAMNPDISEPTSPKVTCAGQIKVRHKNSTATCKNWQSVMEEIERIHNSKKQKKKTTWVEALGFKKEVLQFLTCLRSVKFDFRCFGSFPGSDITSDEDEDEDEDEEDESQENHHDDNIVHSENSGAMFSKWFMLLEDEPSNELATKDDMAVSQAASSAPPPNALLLMRCRSAPAKNRFKDEEETDKEKEMEQEEATSDKEKSTAPEEEKKKKRESLMVVMKYDTDFYKLSCDTAKETWVTGGVNDPFSRSRSWKR